MPARRRGGKSAEAFRTISEVAGELALPQHVLRFWETKFPQIKPLKRGGGRRYYRPQDMALLRRIQSLLYGDGYTIRGVQKLLREDGAKSVLEEGNSSEDSTVAAGTPDTGHEALKEILAELESLRDLLRRAGE